MMIFLCLGTIRVREGYASSNLKRSKEKEGREGRREGAGWGGERSLDKFDQELSLATWLDVSRLPLTSKEELKSRLLLESAGMKA
jgi:hypothetical protein